MARTVLHISTRLILGGSQENTVLSCEGQARLGHRVHLAFGPIYGPEGSLLERVLAFNARCAAGEERTVSGGACGPIGVHEVPHLVREVSPRADRACLRELRELIGRTRPDVVHTHSSKAGILGRMAAWEDGGRARAVVHTIHGPPFMPVEGGALRRVKTRLVNGAYTLAERHAARRCHVIVSVADAMTAQFVRRGIGRGAQYITVRSGMEVERFVHAGPGEDRGSVRAGLGIAADDFVVGTVARLAEHKGHDDVLTALGEELRARPGWKLLWVGDGWLRERLLSRVREMGLAGRVVTTGLVPSERVPAFLRAMDVLAHPSSREGLPRTVPQGLLCGVCPVAYDVDGTREVCIDAAADPVSGTGRLVPHGDVAGLREAVLWLHADPARRARLAARGGEMVRREYSAARMVERLEEVYDRAAAMASGG